MLDANPCDTDIMADHAAFAELSQVLCAMTSNLP